MKSTWRLAVFAVALVATSGLLAPPVGAQKGGPSLFPAGQYRLSFGGADFFGSSGNLTIPFLNVTTGTELARPDGAPETTTSDTTIFMFLEDTSTFSFTQVCATLSNPADFAIDHRLGSASLHTTLTPDMPSCVGSPLTSAIGIDATWTGIGPLANSSGSSNYACAGYTAQGSGSSLSNTATANLALTIGGTTTVFTSSGTGLNSDESRVEAQGAIDPGCGITGFGSGPVPAGHYRYNDLFADGFFMPQPFQFNNVSLIEGSNSSQPGGGPGAAPEFDLDVSLFGGSINGFGCFAVPQTDVTLNGLDSASVQTTTNGTPCTNTQPGFGLSFPLTVNATWTASGPSVTLHDQSNFHCLGYSNSTSTFVESRTADSSATVTMPDYFGNPVTEVLTGGFGDLTQVRQSIQASGVLSSSCLFRG